MANSTPPGFAYNASSTVDGQVGRLNIYPCQVAEIILCSAIFALGSLGNGLILRVYWVKRHKTSTHILIMGLAFADLVVCLSQTFFITETTFTLADKQLPDKWVFVHSVANTWTGMSVGITAVIALDRYDCVCRPHKRWISCRRAKMATAFVAVLSVASEASNMVCNVLSCEISAPLEWTTAVAGFVTALLMIVVCYGKVYFRIRQHVKVSTHSRQDGGTFGTDRKKLNSGQSGVTTMIAAGQQLAPPASSLFPKDPKDPPRLMTTVLTGGQTIGDSAGNSAVRPLDTNLTQTNPPIGQQSARFTWRSRSRAVLHKKTTQMLFITSVVFVLLWLPSWTSIAVSLTVFRDTKDQNLKSLLEELIPTTYFINNAVNPLIYGLANKQFRGDCKKELHKMLQLCCG